MPPDALLIALGSAVLHAGWNVLLAGARDTRAATAGALTLVAALALPAAALTWDIDAEALPYLAASMALELAYISLLAAAYARADLGVVYPIARGSAPVLVLVGAVALGRGDPTGLQVAGVLLVAGGVVALRGLGAHTARGRDVGLALAIGATVAGYVVADDAGLDHAATIPYLCAVVGVPAAVYAAAYAARRGLGEVRRPSFALRIGPAVLDRKARRRAGLRHAAKHGARAIAAELDARTAGIAAGMVAAFGLALAALELADPAPVAAVRESSVLVGALLAPRLLGEAGGRARVAGAAAVFAGVAAVALG